MCTACSPAMKIINSHTHHSCSTDTHHQGSADTSTAPSTAGTFGSQTRLTKTQPEFWLGLALDSNPRRTCRCCLKQLQPEDPGLCISVC